MTADRRRAAVRDIQKGVCALGYDPGPADGLWGPWTRAAVLRMLGADARMARGAPAAAPAIRQGEAGHPVREIIVHCAATRPDWMANQPFEAQAAEIRRWHVEGNGWRDIGYHWLIGRGGECIAGRPETAIGAHVAGRNAGTIGVCLIGGHGSAEHDRLGDHFTLVQEHALLGLIAGIEARAAIERITGHNQFAAKACPGFHVPTWLAAHRRT